MKSTAKYAIGLIPTALVGWAVGYAILFALGGGGHRGHDYPPRPFSAGTTFAFPYWAMSWGGERSLEIGGLWSILQIPVYGGLLTWAWVKGKLRCVVASLACVHFAATSLAFAVSQRGVRAEGAEGVFDRVYIHGSNLNPGFRASMVERLVRDCAKEQKFDFPFEDSRMSVNIYTDAKKEMVMTGWKDPVSDAWKEVVADVEFYTLLVKINRHGYAIRHKLTRR